MINHEPLDNGHWKYPTQMGVKPYVGFVYLIRNPKTNNFYIGKKLYRAMRGESKGQETSWRRYCSSSKLLKAMLSENGKKDYEFYTLGEYKSKGALAWAEVWSLCFVEAPTREDCLNKMIDRVSWKVTEPVSRLHQLRLIKLINWEDV